MSELSEVWHQRITEQYHGPAKTLAKTRSEVLQRGVDALRRFSTPPIILSTEQLDALLQKIGHAPYEVPLEETRERELGPLVPSGEGSFFWIRLADSGALGGNIGDITDPEEIKRRLSFLPPEFTKASLPQWAISALRRFCNPDSAEYDGGFAAQLRSTHQFARQHFAPRQAFRRKSLDERIAGAIERIRERGEKTTRTRVRKRAKITAQELDDYLAKHPGALDPGITAASTFGPWSHSQKRHAKAVLP